jgi:hypothetical protein
MLTFLRKVYPYTASAKAPDTPLERAEKTGRVFLLNELMIISETESFRRDLLMVLDALGKLMLELKMPGEVDGKRYLTDAHFTVARELWDKYPDDPGTPKVPFFGRWKGRLPLYGAPRSFESTELGLALIHYEDGKRLLNKYRLTSHKKKLEVLRQAWVDTAVYAIRLHELGWRGIDPIGGSDMHMENARWLLSGRGALAADFNNFQKVGRGKIKRSIETLHLLFGDVDGAMYEAPGFKKAIYDDVLARVTRRSCRWNCGTSRPPRGSAWINAPSSTACRR